MIDYQGWHELFAAAADPRIACAVPCIGVQGFCNPFVISVHFSRRTLCRLPRCAGSQSMRTHGQAMEHRALSEVVYLSAKMADVFLP